MGKRYNKFVKRVKNIFKRTEKTEEEKKLDEFFDREQSFNIYNSNKIHNILSVLPAKKKEVFKLIPILVCFNDKSLPGYVHTRSAMQGMSRFSLSPEGKKLLLKYFKKFSLKSPETRVPAVELLALIGSMGSVAQTESSDFDFWVCTNFSNFSKDQLANFRHKLSEIEEWAQKAGDLEIHFFLMDIKQVQSNDFGESGGESSGTALSKLLKEEFYRTAVYICGKLPYWCIIHNEADDTAYDEDVSFLSSYNHFCTKNYVDIGNVYQISKNEFFGAALWEIVKGWQFPFKSILKMALLEKYICSDLTSELLCNNLKKNVFKDPHALKNDPYILLFNSILSFYELGENSKDLEMIKTCFYIKTHLKGSEIISARSKSDIKDERTRRYLSILKDYLKEFNWDMETHEHLEAFNDWTVKETNSFLTKIDNSMLNMYKRIMKIAKVGGSIVISDTDLTIIGRKIQSIFRRVPRKIPFIAAVHKTGNVGSIVLHEAQIHKWDLHFGTRRVLNPILTQKDVVYSTKDIFEIIGWIALNEYYRDHIYIFVKSTFSLHSPNELKNILGDLQRKFFPLDISSIPSRDLLKKERIKKIYVITNYEKDIQSTIESLHVFYLNSWGEFFYKKFEGESPTISFCNTLLANTEFDYAMFKENMYIYIPKKVVGIHSSANKLLQNLLSNMANALNRNADADVCSRFVTIVDEKIAVFYLEENTIKISYFNDIKSLYNFFELPTLKKTVVTKADDFKAIGHLRLMCNRVKYGQINLILTPRKKNESEITVIDEVGNIFYCGTFNNVELPYTFAHLKSFAENTIRKNIINNLKSPFCNAPDIKIKFYKISSEGNKFYALDSTKVINQQIRSLNLNPSQLKVKRGLNKKGDEGYKISLNDETFDDSEYPDVLGELSKRIKKLRGSKKSYNIFITELSLDTGFTKKFCPTFASFSHFLIYKEMLENKLGL